ncbi:MAG: NAD(P)/FAD-dependent oxidoreductase [Limnochordia bacterium]
MLYDVAVVGGGIVGCALARELARYRLRIIVLERGSDVAAGTSKANSGIIHAGHHSSSGTLKGELEWVGNQMWDQLHADLGFGFRRAGELTVARTSDEIATLEALKKQGEAKGVPDLEIWGQERVRKEEPNLSPEIVAALYAPTSGVVNPYEACMRMAYHARLNGVEFSMETLVTGIQSEEEALVVETSKGSLRTRFVINAAGVHADDVAALAGVGDFTLRIRKGEEYLLDKRLMGIVKRTIFPCPSEFTKGILVIPTVEGTIMVGPTSHFVSDKEDLTTTPMGFEEVFRAARALVPAISERDCIAQFAGLRAVAPSEDFIIGTTALRGFINVAGIQSPGLTAAPAIALRVVDILVDEGLELVPKDDYVSKPPPRIRFAELSRDEQRRLIEKDPSFGRIVCRCEHVTEGEILEAIRSGARTLDGLKFRTRAGMGRCQGGFCTARCMELLARELEIPLAEVTKGGRPSWIAVEPTEEAKPR